MGIITRRIGALHTTRQRGFTIAELLIVVTVIGILATIVFIGYGAVADRAEATRVAKQAKDLQTEVDIYRVRNKTLPGDEFFPACSGSSICMANAYRAKNTSSTDSQNNRVKQYSPATFSGMGLELQEGFSYHNIRYLGVAFSFVTATYQRDTQIPEASRPVNREDAVFPINTPHTILFNSGRNDSHVLRTATTTKCADGSQPTTNSGSNTWLTSGNLIQNGMITAPNQMGTATGNALYTYGAAFSCGGVSIGSIIAPIKIYNVNVAIFPIAR